MSDPRVRLLNAADAIGSKDYVLYWCQIQRRAEDNAALAYAVARANELGKPCLVYEAVRPDYPFANDRIHTFMLQGARVTARRLAQRGIAYAFFLPRTPAEARGVVARLASRACMVVSDDFPTFTIPAQNAAAAARAACAYAVVDDAAAVPLALFPKEESAARTFRPKIHRILDEWLRPLDDPEPRVSPPAHLDLPFTPVDLERANLGELVASCAIDHDVPPVALAGGTDAAEARLTRFLQQKLHAYDVDRNDPSRDATSRLSPYLHFGMISARRVALAAREAGDAAAAFVEQLLVRRGLAYVFARTNPQHATYDAVPAWAQRTLEEHRKDPRLLVSEADLEAARSPDDVWNAAQLELRATGVIQNYLRMLWGKLVLTWTPDARTAHATLVRLNDRFALDGRDPDGYANIGWCFGLHDRPWPERAIFGKVRTMTSRSARTKLDLESYLAQAPAWRDAAGC